MSNIKRFKQFKEQINEHSEEMSVKDHVSKMMNILYGMDEKYAENPAVSYNEIERKIRIKLDTVEEADKIADYLESKDYHIVDRGEETLEIDV